MKTYLFTDMPRYKAEQAIKTLTSFKIFSFTGNPSSKGQQWNKDFRGDIVGLYVEGDSEVIANHLEYLEEVDEADLF